MKKQTPAIDDSRSLNMPVFKNNKRIFLNQLEKYTSDLLSHLEDLDFSQPQELSQIDDVLSDDLKSEKKNNSPPENNGILPKLNIPPSNLYYERKGYKNYKYKLFDIDLDEIGKCQKLGKKFDVKKFLEENPIDKGKSLDSKSKEHKKRKNNNLLILSKKLQKFSKGGCDLKENIDDNRKNNKSLLPKIQQSKSMFSMMNNEYYFKPKENIQEKINHLIQKTERDGVSFIKYDNNRKDPMILENFSVMNQISEQIENAENGDNRMKIQQNNLNISKIINKINFLCNLPKEEKFSIGAKKEINILNEFISLCKSATITGVYENKKGGLSL